MEFYIFSKLKKVRNLILSNMFDIKIMTVIIMIIWVLINISVIFEDCSRSTKMECFELINYILYEISDV